MSPNQYYLHDNVVPDSYPDYSPYKEMVTVNNNYLQLNPIYDTSSNKIDLNDENTIDMTILVPEKYISYQEDIQKLYTDYHTQCYYQGEDIFKAKTGNGDTIKDHEALNVNIMFVKNNQSYFTYNPNYCKDTGNEIIDPIAVIINNKNMGADHYMPIISRGEYFYDVENKNNTSIEDLIKEAGVENNIIRINKIYNQVDEYIYQLKSQIVFESILFTTIMFILLLIVIYSTLNYMEENKKANAIKKIHGVSFIKRHYQHLIKISLYWITIFFIMSIVKNLFKFNDISIPILSIGTLGLMFVDYIASYIRIKLKELKNTKDILKGE